MTNNFSHVEDPVVRRLLNGDFSEEGLCHALAKCQEYLATDESDEGVSPELQVARKAYLEEAKDWWNVEGNPEKAVASLQKFFGV